MRKRQKRMRFLCVSAMMAAILAILAPITIPMGAIPCTLAVFVLFLVASIFPPSVTFAAVLTYLLLGAVGLPVFSAFSGGFSAFVSPSGGFLWGYLPASLLLSFMSQRAGRFFFLLIAMFVSLSFLYAVGLVGFMILTEATLGKALWAVIPFLPIDIGKIILASLIAILAKKRSGKFGE